MATENKSEAHPDGRDDVINALSVFLTDFMKESDRAAVVVGAAKLDILLRQLLQQFLIPCPSGSDELLDTERPLGTFSARIHACQRLGLIDSAFARALHLIRKIRNDFAHETSSISLSSGSYADRIRDLIAPLKDLKSFKSFRKIAEATPFTSGAKDFRVALAVLCVRLEMAVHYARTISPTNAVTLDEAWIVNKLA